MILILIYNKYFLYTIKKYNKFNHMIQIIIYLVSNDIIFFQ